MRIEYYFYNETERLLKYQVDQFSLQEADLEWFLKITLQLVHFGKICYKILSY